MSAELALRRSAAWSVIDAAIDAGFALRAAGDDRLEVLTPPELDRETSSALLAGLEKHRHEVVQTLRFLDECGVQWSDLK